MGKPLVFISYSHEDECWKDRLVKHLMVLECQGILELWHDRHVRPGCDWRDRIFEALDRARLAVYLISKNSLTSDFITGEEVGRALRRHEEEGLPIYSVIVSPCDWKGVAWLSRMQLRPQHGQPLSRGRKHEIEADLAEIAREIRGMIGTLPDAAPSPVSPGRLARATGDGKETAVLDATASIEVKINRDFTTYSQKDQEALLCAISIFLDVSGDIRVTNKQPGSVKLTLELTFQQAERLLWAAKGGEFAGFDVVDARIVDCSSIAPDGGRATEVVDDIPWDPDRLKRHFASRLRNRIGHLNVVVRDDSIILEGHARSPRDRQAVQQTIEEIYAVSRVPVINRIRIVRAPPQRRGG